MKLTELGPFPGAPGYDKAASLDESDPLRLHRDRYVHADPDLIYLDGNSLGRLPVDTIQSIETTVHDQWGGELIRAWNDGWWDLQLSLGDKLAPLLGAQPGEVVISDSTSVNLYKLALAAVIAAPRARDRIVTDDLNFPSDVYILDSVARQTGRTLEIAESDGTNGPIARLTDLIDEHTALVSLSHTTYQSGYTYDLAEVTRLAQETGAMMLWDCSHSVGAMPIDLGGADVDLAVGCTYKYLNGGPGSPAFLYVKAELQDQLANPIAGWWSHAEPFALDLDYRPASGIRRFHTGTMPIISLAAIEAGIDDVLDASIDAIRAKSIALTEYLIEEYERSLQPLGFHIASPRDRNKRGSHISVRHREAWPINVALIKEARVIPDFRAPDTIRLGLSPLYTRFVDVHTAVQRTAGVVKARIYEQYSDVVTTVT
ncbi:MAG TPA: kynureninase [Acidimicrobiia bacterium]